MRSDIQSDTPWVNIQDAIQIFGVLTDHIATSQLDTRKNQATGDCIILNNTKKDKNFLEIGPKCAPFYISYILSQYFRFSW